MLYRGEWEAGGEYFGNDCCQGAGRASSGKCFIKKLTDHSYRKTKALHKGKILLLHFGLMKKIYCTIPCTSCSIAG